MVRKMAWIGSSWTFGLFFASFFVFPYNLIFGAVTIGAAIAYKLLSINRFKIPAFTVILTAGIAMCWSGCYDALIYRPAVLLSGENTTMSGTIRDATPKSQNNTSYIIKVDGKPWNIYVYGATQNYNYGDKITVEGVWEIPENSLTFPTYQYYKSKQIFLQCMSPTAVTVTPQKPTLFTKVLNYRDWLINQILRYLPGDQASIIIAMLCGDKSGIDDNVKTNLYRVGIGHMMSVSGTHLTIICSFISVIFNKKRKFPFLKLILITCIGGLFAVFSGLSVSVIRAFIMLVAVNIGNIFRRKGDPFTSLALAATLLTLPQPFAIRDASLLLSCVGTLGMSVFSPYLVKNFPSKASFSKPISLLKAPLQLLCTNAVIFPTSLLFFTEISIISPLSNLILVPLGTIVLISSAIAGIATIITGNMNIIAQLSLSVASSFAGNIMEISDLINRLNIGYISLSSDQSRVASITIAACVIIISIVFIFYIRNRPEHARRLLSGCLLTAFLLTVLSTSVQSLLLQNKFSITVLGSQTRYAIVAQHGSTAWIIDKGANAKYVRDYLQRTGTRTIESVLIPDISYAAESHYAYVLKPFTVKEVALRPDHYVRPDTTLLSVIPSINIYNDTIRTYDSLKLVISDDSITFYYGDATFVCLTSPDTNEQNNTQNNRTVYVWFDNDRWQTSLQLKPTMSKIYNNSSYGILLSAFSNGQWQGRRIQRGYT